MIFTAEEFDAIRESLKYSKRAIEDGSAPRLVKEHRLSVLDDVLRKLKGIESEPSGS
jgi:hypothetical protein